MKFIFLNLFIIIVFSGNCLADKASSANNKGIKAYKEKDYEKSAQHFTDALVNKPGTSELLFNLGTALSAMGKKEEALKEFSKIPDTKGNKYLSSSTHFNSGNLLLESGDNEGAIKEYSKALKIDQKSRDIRHNLELAIKRKAEQAKQKKSSSQSDRSGNQPENQNQPDNQKNQLRREENDQENMSISEEEAQRILNAFQNEERRALELKKNKQTTKQRLGNDW